MRNIKEHPVTRDEIAECLRGLATQFANEMAIGDMRPLLLGLAAQIVAKERDNKLVYGPDDLMRLCKDCKWCMPDKSPEALIFGMRLSNARCRVAPKPQKTDPVTGRVTAGGFWLCSAERLTSEGTCGTEGKLFEPLAKPSDL